MAHMRYIRSLKFVNSIASKKKVTSSLPPITFTDEDFKGIDRCHNDPMVVKIEVTNFLVCNVLLNNRSSVGVLYWSALKQLGIPESQIKPLPKQVIGFVGETTDTIGYVHLLTTFKDERGSKSIMIKYILIGVLTSYNILIRLPSLNELGAIILIPYLVMKFPSEDEKIITVRADKMIAKECYVLSLMISNMKNMVEPKVQLVVCTSLNINLGEFKLDLREVELRAEPTKEVIPTLKRVISVHQTQMPDK